ncbi:EamA family transporter [Nocardioides halotolerans]|jgi:drug/metabolite transporter (DMT)-like permease|uniref:EamA family transporter n=1 Tax=Nocardioides halotolerans TaxID=433660 RepID=UPI000404DD67|nr:DMT family transporter [Nocardioides halotolerans]
MTAMTHDAPLDAVGGRGAAPSRLTAGLLFALVSAVSFGMSGALARGLIETGWSAGAMTLVRVALAAVALTPLGLASLRGRWVLLRRNLGLLGAYGVIAVAGAQFCYFSAVQHMQVGPAILMEFTAPAVVVVYLWLRHGQRPSRMTLAGAAVAAAGLVLVLDLVSGADLSLPGVLWALGAMVGCATYFIISADEDNGLPPLVLAWAGLLVGALALALLGIVGVLPMRTSTATTSYADVEVAWWVPLVVLGLVTAALSYVAGIAAGRRLGSRLASFVALLEVVASVFWAWLLLHELPGTVQLFGGLLILAGVVGVKLGERSVVVRTSAPA